jgi:hypothetical protein
MKPAPAPRPPRPLLCYYTWMIRLATSELLLLSPWKKIVVTTFLHSVNSRILSRESTYKIPTTLMLSMSPTMNSHTNTSLGIRNRTYTLRSSAGIQIDKGEHCVRKHADRRRIRFIVPRKNSLRRENSAVSGDPVNRRTSRS